MKRIAAMVGLCGILAGCVAPIYGNQLSWRPKNSSGAPYVITNKFDHEMMFGGNVLHLYINGKEVVKGSLSPINNSGSFVGKYKGHTVSVDCRQTFTDVNCTVFMDSEKVGSF